MSQMTSRNSDDGDGDRSRLLPIMMRQRNDQADKQVLADWTSKMTKAIQQDCAF